MSENKNLNNTNTNNNNTRNNKVSEKNKQIIRTICLLILCIAPIIILKFLSKKDSSYSNNTKNSKPIIFPKSSASFNKNYSRPNTTYYYNPNSFINTYKYFEPTTTFNQNNFDKKNKQKTKIPHKSKLNTQTVSVYNKHLLDIGINSFPDLIFLIDAYLYRKELSTSQGAEKTLQNFFTQLTNKEMTKKDINQYFIQFQNFYNINQSFLEKTLSKLAGKDREMYKKVTSMIFTMLVNSNNKNKEESDVFNGILRLIVPKNLFINTYIEDINQDDFKHNIHNSTMLNLSKIPPSADNIDNIDNIVGSLITIYIDSLIRDVIRYYKQNISYTDFFVKNSLDELIQDNNDIKFNVEFKINNNKVFLDIRNGNFNESIVIDIRSNMDNNIVSENNDEIKHELISEHNDIIKEEYINTIAQLAARINLLLNKPVMIAMEKEQIKIQNYFDDRSNITDKNTLKYKEIINYIRIINKSYYSQNFKRIFEDLNQIKNSYEQLKNKPLDLMDLMYTLYDKLYEFGAQYSSEITKSNERTMVNLFIKHYNYLTKEFMLRIRDINTLNIILNFVEIDGRSDEKKNTIIREENCDILLEILENDIIDLTTEEEYDIKNAIYSLFSIYSKFNEIYVEKNIEYIENKPKNIKMVLKFLENVLQDGGFEEWCEKGEAKRILTKITDIIFKRINQVLLRV